MTARKPKLLVFGASVALLAIFASATMFLDQIDHWGTDFFVKGTRMVTPLDAFAQALASKDVIEIENFHSDDFSGNSLGLTNLETIEEKDGVRRSLFRSTAESIDRKSAIGEWQIYLDSMDSIEEAGLPL